MLIKQMAQANPLWGAPRIHGELQHLGLEVSERTVSRLMPRRRKPVPSENFVTLYFHRFTTVKSNPCLTSNIAGC
jgi:helix-turn-helix protein